MNKIRKSGIYCIENTVNQKKYIGQSTDVEERWRKHVSELKHGHHHNDYLQKSWNKYGENNFKFYILEYCDINILDDREIYWINFYNTISRDNGYNLKSGGQNGGSILSKYSKEKLRESIKNSYNNSNLREIRSFNALAQWNNPKIKEKITGENNGMYGRHHTDEVKKKISELNKGKPSPRRNKTPVFCIELNKKFLDATTAATELSIDSCGILKVCRKERKTCGGYHWEFITN
nr:MAG TPA: intron associated endonuclease [Caudoviricetes sp.]